MNGSGPVWAVLVTGLIAANVPFFTERLLLVGPKQADKSLAWRLLEMLLLGLLTLGLGFAIESRMGQRQPQGWEFFAAFGFLFLTFAFPGFVWRYLRRRTP
ncbi:MAG: hypothetical protein RJA98_2677 [Pseudomonadota bacterium]|jgi:hypothetical protein